MGEPTARENCWRKLWSASPLDLARRQRHPVLIITFSFMIVAFLVGTTDATLQQMLFILFGAPVMYTALNYGLKKGTAVALASGLVITLGRWPVLTLQWRMADWGHLFFEGLFVPLFYLAFCLFLARVILQEQRALESYRQLSAELRKLADELAAANERNSELFNSTIRALASTIDAKDPYTMGHSERVTHYARQIARKMGLSGGEMELITYAAILHDIGKIGLAEDILAKPGNLSPEEYKEVQRHPGIGANIISAISLLNEVVPLVYYHHEWYDGRGYPEGLKDKDIPLGAKIIAVADCYDAMTSSRPYRKGLSKKQAIRELLDCSGTQFDPRVAWSFVDLLKNEEELRGQVGTADAG